MAKKTNKELLCISSEITFEKVAREWHDVFKGKWSKDYGEVILKRIEADLLPCLGNLPIRDIKAIILLNALRKIENRGVYETTKRARQYCSQILRYAVANGWVERDVSVDIIGAFKQVRVKHYSALDSNDLPEFLKKLERNEARLFPQTRIAIELMLHTFVRTNELLEAKWHEFDMEGKTWLIPAERMKMRKAHLVPLSIQVLKFLNDLKSQNTNSEYILTSLHSSKIPMSNNTILYALYRMGYKGKTTGHGFRALAMTTIKEKLGYRHEVIDRQLAHAHRNSVDAAYDRPNF
ncbi:MAG: tyrosine-type recombinase/integrase [Bacteroidetes bacterium]|nr:tyrosine-type recombinase/integrase [Bacteroidota bacterium]